MRYQELRLRPKTIEYAHESGVDVFHLWGHSVLSGIITHLAWRGKLELHVNVAWIVLRLVKWDRGHNMERIIGLNKNQRNSNVICSPLCERTYINLVHHLENTKSWIEHLRISKQSFVAH